MSAERVSWQSCCALKWTRSMCSTDAHIENTRSIRHPSLIYVAWNDEVAATASIILGKSKNELGRH